MPSNRRWAVGSKTELVITLNPTVCQKSQLFECKQWDLPKTITLHQEPALLRIAGKTDKDVTIQVPPSAGLPRYVPIAAELIGAGHVRVTSNEAVFDLDIVPARSIDVGLVARLPIFVDNTFMEEGLTVPANGASIAGASRLTMTLRDANGGILCGTQPITITAPDGIYVSPDTPYGNDSVQANGAYVLTAATAGDHHIALRTAAGGIESSFDIHVVDPSSLTAIASSFRGQVVDLEYRAGDRRVFGVGWTLEPHAGSPHDPGGSLAADTSFRVRGPTHVTGLGGLTTDVTPP